MSFLEQQRCDLGHPSAAAGALQAALDRGNWVRLLGPHDVPLEVPEALPAGPGLLLSTGGSSGSRQLCLQPSIHLDRSAAATGRWLQALGLNASQVIVWNPLPFQHVSGLMPWIQVGQGMIETAGKSMHEYSEQSLEASLLRRRVILS